MPDDFYQQMDAAGILINAGYQCCDFWEATTYSSADQATYQLSAQSIGQTRAQPPVGLQLPMERQQPDRHPGDARAQRLRRRRLHRPVHLLGRIQVAARNSARPVRRRARTTGCRRSTGTTPRTPRAATSPTPAARGASTARRAPATPYRRSTRSTGSCRRPTSPTLWQTPGANQYHNNYEGTKHTGYAFGTLYNLDTSITNRYGAWSSLAPVRRGSTGRQLREHPGAVRGVHRPLDQRPPRRRPAPSTGSSTRAGRRCSGRSTTTTATRPAPTSARRRPTRPLHAIYTLDTAP